MVIMLGFLLDMQHKADNAQSLCLVSICKLLVNVALLQHFNPVIACQALEDMSRRCVPCPEYSK